MDSFAVLEQSDRLLLERRERLLNLFEKRIYTDSFKDLSGWDKAAVGLPTPEVQINLSPDELHRYVFDRELPHQSLEQAKRDVAHLTSIRDRAHVRPENILLTPGATAALAVVLHFLRAYGIDLILTDPPFYFSIKKLSGSLGMDFVAADRSLDNIDDPGCILRLIKQHRGRRKAVILSHPQYVVSRNYPISILHEVRRSLGSNDLLVLDQSTDMEFCNQDNILDLDSQFIKVRTLGKALSLNGSRLAVLVANNTLTSRLNRYASILYGSLDVAMVRLGSVIAQDPVAFERHLEAVRRLVKDAFLEARLLLGDDAKLELAYPENGFLGYIAVDTTRIGRFMLYQSLLRHSVLAMFSAHVGLRQLYTKELVRVNYLLDIRGGLLAMRDASAQSVSSLAATAPRKTRVQPN